MTVLTQDLEFTGAAAPADGRTIQRVLVAFDGSPGAWAALRRGIDVAVAEHARLTLAGVVTYPRLVWVAPGPMCVPYTPEAMRRDGEREMQQILAAARDEVPATVSVTTQVLHGRPAHALAALAEAGHYDLVVTGPRPAGPLRRLLRGSVTHSLLSRCRTSVLAVRAPDA